MNENLLQKIEHWFRNILISIKNLCIWLPVIWKDRDWDQVFFLQILKFKIKRMRLYHEKHKRYVGWQKNTKIMKDCEKLIQRRLDDVYAEACGYKSELSEFEWIPCDKSKKPLPPSSQCIKEGEDPTKIKPVPESYQLKIKYKGGMTAKKQTEIFRKAEELKQKELQQLFKLIADNIEGWWD